MKLGFKLEGKKEIFLFGMYNAWKEGISTREYRRCWKKDLKDIAEIQEAIDMRLKREENVNELKAQMGLR